MAFEHLIKGGVTLPRAAKILALPGRGGGLTHARIFLVNLTFNIHSVQNSLKIDKIDKIDALFVAKSTSVPGLGGGGAKPILAMPGFWQLSVEQ